MAPLRKNIFTTGELGMKAGANLKKGSGSAAHNDLSFSRRRDSRQDFQRGFSRAISSDNTDYFPCLISRLTSRSAQNSSFFEVPTTCFALCFANWKGIFENTREHVTQRDIPAPLVGNVILFPHIFYFNDRFHVFLNNISEITLNLFEIDDTDDE